MTGRVVRVGRALLPIVVSAGLAFGGCSGSDEDLPYAPPNCSHQAPSTGYVIPRVTLNSQNPSVKLIIFRGNWEENVVALEDTVTIDRPAFELPAGKYYSVLARYLVGVDTVLALDGGNLSVKSEEFRDATCYSVPDVDLDLRLVD